jgi:hypothetical protein
LDLNFFPVDDWVRTVIYQPCALRLLLTVQDETGRSRGWAIFHRSAMLQKWGEAERQGASEFCAGNPNPLPMADFH